MIVMKKVMPSTMSLIVLFLDPCTKRTPKKTRMICLGSVRKVATAKNQNLTLQVEKTAVEKWEGMIENRTIRTI